MNLDDAQDIHRNIVFLMRIDGGGEMDGMVWYVWIWTELLRTRVCVPCIYSHARS